ncbi:hypothetical protein ACFVVX_25430 [Kitasatospora sp. NPDC058170]|uniref:hypothetical protein n=1 Tax=Kitasatospora sp. NPDC058170 TaxID=3346364 RepID=UPI0036D7C42F
MTDSGTEAGPETGTESRAQPVGGGPGPRPLADELLLDTWERASALAPVGRPLALLAAVWPGHGWERLAAEPLGRSTARLAELRRSLVGDAVEAVASCPSCAGLVEVGFPLSLLSGSGPGGPVGPDGPDPESGAELSVTAEGHEVRCRPVTTGDVLAVRGAADPASALLARCVTGAVRLGEAVPAGELPEGVRASVEEALAAADPQAEPLLGLDCPACDTQWWAPFDLGAFLWAEVERLALHTLGEVDALARAYGWRESDILALGRIRRRRYLDLVRA